MGKYDEVLKKLTKLPVEIRYQEFGGQKYQAKVDEVKSTILTAPSEEIAHLVHESTQDQRDEKLRTIITEINTLSRMFYDACGHLRWASRLSEGYAEVRKAKDALKESLSGLNLVLNAYEQLVIEQLEVEGTTGLTLTNGDKIRSQPEPHAKVEDPDAFREWCVKEGLERSLQLPWGTTNSMTKERLLNGDPEPPGVKAYSRDKIVFTEK